MYGALGLGDDTPSVVVEPSEVQLVGVKQASQCLFTRSGLFSDVSSCR